MVLRHDLQRLADAGVISGVLGTWPVPWREIDEALSDPELAVEAPGLMVSVRRVRAAARRALVDGGTAREVRVGGSDEPALLQGYADMPREKGEISLAVEHRTGDFAGRLEATAVHDPVDGDDERLNGSFASWRHGNWWFGAGGIDRWWGPGWEGSLILSNNARSFPALFIERDSAEPFSHDWWNWMGPWRLSTFLGRMESGRFVPRARVWGLRFAFQPFDSLTVGLSRTAMFDGGKGRSIDLEGVFEMLGGDDNTSESGLDSDEPGDQMAGIDLRWAPRWFEIDTAFYMQRIGEDWSGGKPTRDMGQYGLELAGGTGGGASWRVFWEYARTIANGGINFPSDDSERNYNIAYNHGIYKTGHRYHGRSMGHTFGGDSDVHSLGGIFVTRGGHAFDGVLRVGELNEDGKSRAPEGHSVAPNGADLEAVQIGYRPPLDNPVIHLRAGAARIGPLGAEDISSDNFLAVEITTRF